MHSTCTFSASFAISRLYNLPHNYFDNTFGLQDGSDSWTLSVSGSNLNNLNFHLWVFKALITAK
jgi:hypothetical protein